MDTAKAELKQWIRNQIQGHSEVTISEVANQVIAHYGEDRDFINTLLSEVAKPLIWDITQEVLADTRKFVGGDVITTEQGIKQRINTHPVFSKWMEHAGDRHIQVMEMRRRDLLLAAQERQERGDHEHALASLWRNMAARLGPQQKVKTVFSEQDIQNMLDNIRGEEVAIAAD